MEEEIMYMLPVKFCQIPVRGCRAKVEMSLSKSEAREAIFNSRSARKS